MLDMLVLINFEIDKLHFEYDFIVVEGIYVKL